jgi:hypothetical protein
MADSGKAKQAYGRAADEGGRNGRVGLRGGRPWGGDGAADVLIRGGVVEQIGPRVAAASTDVLDVTGLLMLPGLVERTAIWTRRCHAYGLGQADASTQDRVVALLAEAGVAIVTAAVYDFRWHRSADSAQPASPSHVDTTVFETCGARTAAGTCSSERCILRIGVRSGATTTSP